MKKKQLDLALDGVAPATPKRRTDLAGIKIQYGQTTSGRPKYMTVAAGGFVLVKLTPGEHGGFNSELYVNGSRTPIFDGFGTTVQSALSSLWSNVKPKSSVRQIRTVAVLEGP